MVLMIYGVACIYFLAASVMHTETKKESNSDDDTFLSVYGFSDYDDSYSLVVMMYYSLTILSTVGYGDYFPISPEEMILTVFIMLMGIAVFSWIMGEITILS